MSELTVNETRQRLTAFAHQWKDASRENADAKLFWARFYECFGIRPESSTIYEKAVDKLDGARGFIDSFIPGLLIVEHKSRGKSLDAAYAQAADYFVALSEAERPRYIITSDFARLRLVDLKTGTHSECTLKDLPKRAGWFRFLTEGDAPEIIEESPINRQAAYAVSKLHEALLLANFTGRDLEVFLTRLLFCFFADDTGIFGSDGQFRAVVEATRDDGRDTGARLAELFEILNTSEAQRQTNLDEQLAAFAYINGSLFAEHTRIPAFNADLRVLLVQCAELDWSAISPAIFGAMFQGVLEAHTPTESRQSSRRELGAHYTSERNILRVINPLFMDDLRAELAGARRSKPRLKALYDKLPELTFFDPACGCGNFLVMAYRELRKLENEVIAALFDFDQGRGLLDVSTLCRVRVSQFYGIEIDEAAAHIARVALWITDHQMNLDAATRFGNTRPTVPLVDSPTIVRANALQTDWADVLAPQQCSFVMGNPPFIGKTYQNAAQRSDMERVFAGVKNAGLLDYVAAWYVKAARYLRQGSFSGDIPGSEPAQAGQLPGAHALRSLKSPPAATPPSPHAVGRAIGCAFVSTNSICQGEQVAVLWPALLQAGVQIRFAHRTFKWNNEGKGNAAVHCVIVGFGLDTPAQCSLWDYSEDPKGEGVPLVAKRINPYLVDAPDVWLEKRRHPICAVPEISFGSMANDGGNLLLSDADKHALLVAEPEAAKWIRPFLGAEEFINNIPRWCLWLVGISPAELRALPEVYKRVQAVKAVRLESTRETTQELAMTPSLFGEIRQPKRNYLLVPLHSSENRQFVPIGYFGHDVICGNANSLIPDATLYHFAVLTSTLHNAWMRAVCGRIKSDYRYSNTTVYNNYPWPASVTAAQRSAIEAAGQAVLDARALYPDSSLADLYDPLAMPPELQKAHHAVDKAVDAAYGYKGDKSDAPRVAFLFALYQKFTSLLPVPKTVRRKKNL